MARDYCIPDEWARTHTHTRTHEHAPTQRQTPENMNYVISWRIHWFAARRCAQINCKVFFSLSCSQCAEQLCSEHTELDAEGFLTSCSGNRSGSIFAFWHISYLAVTPVKVQMQFKEAPPVVFTHRPSLLWYITLLTPDRLNWHNALLIMHKYYTCPSLWLSTCVWALLAGIISVPYLQWEHVCVSHLSNLYFMQMQVCNKHTIGMCRSTFLHQHDNLFHNRLVTAQQNPVQQLALRWGLMC